MELGVFEKVCYEFYKKCDRMALHLLGDPLKNKNLPKYLEIATQYHHKIEIVTSGYYLHLWDFDFLLKAPIVQFNISLSAYSDPCNPKDDDYLARCLEFARFHQKNQSKCFVNLRMHTSRLDNDIAQKFCDAFGVECMFERKRIKLGEYLFLTLSKDFEWISKEETLLNANKLCHGLVMQIGVLSNGVVVPCCIDCEGGIKLGNIAHQSLDEILSSSLTQKIIQGFQKGVAYHKQCQKCTYPAKLD